MLEAVELIAESLATGLPSGTRLAVVAFESASDRLSDFIMDELAASLIRGEGIIPRCLQRLKLKAECGVLSPRPFPRENEIPRSLLWGILLSMGWRLPTARTLGLCPGNWIFR